MNRLLSSFVIVAILSLGSAFSAQAASIPPSTISLSPTVIAGNVDLADVNLVYRSYLATSDLPGKHILPFASTPSSQYIYVRGTGQATYSLTEPQNTFSFNWGTVGRHDTLTVTRSDNTTYDVFGSSILSLASTLLPGSNVDKTGVYVTLFDSLGIRGVAFATLADSFEFSDLYDPSVVPLPAALPLFGAALLGVAFVRRRRAVTG